MAGPTKCMGRARFPRPTHRGPAFVRQDPARPMRAPRVNADSCQGFFTYAFGRM
jgi:hypothetical protein